MVLTQNKKGNFETLQDEIYILISNSKTDKELVEKIEKVLKFYKESTLNNL